MYCTQTYLFCPGCALPGTVEGLERFPDVGLGVTHRSQGVLLGKTPHVEEGVASEAVCPIQVQHPLQLGVAATVAGPAPVGCRHPTYVVELGVSMRSVLRHVGHVNVQLSLAVSCLPYAKEYAKRVCVL